MTFTYTLNVPVAASGTYSFAVMAILRQGDARIRLVARPDPLVLAPTGGYHSTDTDGDRRISLTELTRMIELYNTRNGTVRTGSYTVQDGTEDGFAPDPARAPLATVTLAKYHSADTTSPRDGKLDLNELTRVIQIYNYRNGTVRTGQYHNQAETEDGFAPGP